MQEPAPPRQEHGSWKGKQELGSLADVIAVWGNYMDIVITWSRNNIIARVWVWSGVVSGNAGNTGNMDRGKGRCYSKDAYGGEKFVCMSWGCWVEKRSLDLVV